jgi:hypothetical protein
MSHGPTLCFASHGLLFPTSLDSFISALDLFFSMARGRSDSVMKGGTKVVCARRRQTKKRAAA